MILHKRIIKKYLTNLNIIQPEALYPYLGWEINQVKTLFIIKIIFDAVYDKNYASNKRYYFAVRFDNGVYLPIIRSPK